MVDDIDILHKEIQSWDKFRYALRKENAVLFDQMLKECLEEDKEGRQLQFANAMNASGDNFGILTKSITKSTHNRNQFSAN